MISYIRGTLAEKNEDSAVVEAHGVGYQIFVPVPVLSELPPLGESVKIYTYFSVREDGMSLFGFLSRQDLAMFKQLIGVNGIGLTSGFTTPDLDEANVKRAVAQHSYVTYILADHSKFDKASSVSFAPLSQACILTDREPDPKFAKHCIIKAVSPEDLAGL